jgi:hypothetical protein
MSTPTAPTDTVPATTASASQAVTVLAQPSWPWRWGALILASAAQLMTIAAGGILHIGLFVGTVKLWREQR